MLEGRLQGELHQWLASHLADMSSPEKAAWQKQTLHLTPGGAGVSLLWAGYKDALWLLLAAALCVLLVACANIANLQLARGLRNRQQTAVHLALGSPRGRLVRRALVDSLVVAAMGCAAAMAVAWAGARLILHLAYARSRAKRSWIPVQASPSLPVLLFAMVVATFTGVLFGIAPAWMMARAEPIEALRGGEPNRSQWSALDAEDTGDPASGSFGGAAERRRDAGPEPAQSGASEPRVQSRGPIIGPPWIPKVSGVPQEQLVPLYRSVESRLRAIPGVRSAGAVFEAPPGGWMTHEVSVEGQPDPSRGRHLRLDARDAGIFCCPWRSHRDG